MNEFRHNIFGVPIWGLFLNDHQYQSMDYIQRLFEIVETEPTQKKSNQNGYQTRDDLNDTEPIFKELVIRINNLSNQILDTVLENQHPPRVEIKEMWGNINYHQNFNWAHTHGGILSGVFYLKVPENSGKLIFLNPSVRSHASLIKEPNYVIQPENLACILFPSWLEHLVEPNQSQEPRISISFNIDIK